MSVRCLDFEAIDGCNQTVSATEDARVTQSVLTLEESCEDYVGRTLIVEPHSGYGWRHPNGGPFGEHGVPTPFHTRIERVYSYKGERRGVLARVNEAGFVYDGYWLVSMNRHLGEWNFTDRPAHYNLLICPEEPVEGKEEDSPEFGELWPVWHLRGQPQASGFGRIAESLQCCADYDAQRDTEARHGSQSADSPSFRYVGTVRLPEGIGNPSDSVTDSRAPPADGELRWVATVFALATLGLLGYAIAGPDTAGLVFPFRTKGQFALGMGVVFVVWTALAVANWGAWFRKK